MDDDLFEQMFATATAVVEQWRNENPDGLPLSLLLSRATYMIERNGLAGAGWDAFTFMRLGLALRTPGRFTKEQLQRQVQHLDRERSGDLARDKHLEGREIDQ